MRRFLTLFLLIVPAAGACSAKQDTCTDRDGATHVSGQPWTEGCQVCSCGDLGDGTLSAVCSHNACPPDGSADAL